MAAATPFKRTSANTLRTETRLTIEKQCQDAITNKWDHVVFPTCSEFVQDGSLRPCHCRNCERDNNGDIVSNEDCYFLVKDVQAFLKREEVNTVSLSNAICKSGGVVKWCSPDEFARESENRVFKQYSLSGRMDLGSG